MALIKIPENAEKCLVKLLDDVRYCAHIPTRIVNEQLFIRYMDNYRIKHYDIDNLHKTYIDYLVEVIGREQK